MDLFVSNNRAQHLVSITYNTMGIRSISKEITHNRAEKWKLVKAYLLITTAPLPESS